MKSRNILFLFIFLYAAVFAYMLNRNLSLEFNGELLALLPADNKHLSTYRKLSNLNYSEGGFDAIINMQNGEKVIEPAHRVADRILSLESEGSILFKNAELENDLHDLKNSALYFMTGQELDSTYRELKKHVEEKKMEANPYYVDFSEPGSNTGADPAFSTESSVLLDDLLDSKQYQVNSDSTLILVSFIPTFPKSDYNKIEKTFKKIKKASSEIEESEGNLEIHWGGSYVDHYNKINDIQYAVLKALVIGTLSLILFLVGYMFYVNTGTGYKFIYIIADLLIAFLILISGFVISLGFFSFLFDEINIFTGIVFSILFGINLDYILHVYSVNKRHGISFSPGEFAQLVRSYLSCTRPIILSSMTTGLAIMSLIFAEFEGFKQFGFIFFINILVNLAATYLFMLFSPSVKGRDYDTYPEKEDLFALPDLYTGSRVRSRKLLIGSLFLLIVTGAFFGFNTLSFNYSFSDLEPRSSQTRFDLLEDELHSGDELHEPSFFITDNLSDSEKLFRHLREGIGKKYTDIAKVESFSARYPEGNGELQSKREKIDSLKQLVAENEQYLDTESDEGNNLVEIVKNTVPPRKNELPKYIKNRFFFKDNSMAPMVMIYPGMSLSDGERSIQFRKSSGTIKTGDNDVYYAASTSIIASSILEILVEESMFLFITPLVTIFILLLVYYRSVRNTFIAIAPLFITFLLLLSLKALVEFDINLYNVIVFPIVIGVGADNGIHLVDSLRSQRENFLPGFLTRKLPVLSACSMTTVLGFIGLLFINHPGMVSLGALAVVSITAILVSTVFTSVAVETFLLKS